MGCVRTPIIGRPRPLPGHRRATSLGSLLHSRLRRAAFPMMSSVVRVRSRSPDSRAFSAQSLSSSTCSGHFFRGEGGRERPPRAPASRARRHSIRWGECSPSRRSSAPRCPAGVASYSARTSSFYSAVNEPRRGLSLRGPMAPSSVPGPPGASMRVLVSGPTCLVLLTVCSTPCRGVSPQVEGQESRTVWMPKCLSPATRLLAGSHPAVATPRLVRSRAT